MWAGAAEISMATAGLVPDDCSVSLTTVPCDLGLVHVCGQRETH